MPDNVLQIILRARNEASAAMSQVETSLGNIQTAVMGVAAAWMGWQGVKKIWDLTVNAASESEQAFNGLQRQMESAGYRWDQVGGQLTDFTMKMQDQTRFSDEQYAEAIKRAMFHTNDYAKAMDVATEAANIAIQSGVDLISAVDMIGMGSEGAARGLKRLGIEVDITKDKGIRLDDILRQIQEKFGDAAQKDLETYAGKMANVGNAAGEMGENLGKKLLQPIKDLYGALDKLGSEVKAPAMVSTLTDLFGILASTVVYNSEKIGDYGMDILKLWGIVKEAPKLEGLGIVPPAETPEAARKAEAEIVEWNEKIFNIQKEWWDKRKEQVNDYTDFYMDKQVQMILAEDGAAAIRTEIATAEGRAKLDTITKQWEAWLKANAEKIAGEKKVKDKTREFHIEGTKSYQQVANIMFNTTHNAVAAIVDSFWTGQLKLADIFKQMAKDFLNLFINAILDKLVTWLIPKILAIFAGFLDNPANDLIVYNQGLDFARHFTRGVTDGFERFNLGGTVAGFSPNAQFASAGIQFNITIINPIGTDQFVTETMVPAIERAITRKQSRIAMVAG